MVSFAFDLTAGEITKTIIRLERSLNLSDEENKNGRDEKTEIPFTHKGYST